MQVSCFWIQIID